MHKPKIDKALLDCRGEPSVPAAPVTNKQAAAYINNLKFAHADCYSKLKRVREVQRDTE